MDKKVIPLAEARKHKKPADILDSPTYPGPGKLTFGALRIMALLLKAKKNPPPRKERMREGWRVLRMFVLHLHEEGLFGRIERENKNRRF